MPNTVVTSTTNSIKVVFNDDSSKVGIDKGTWNKSAVTSFKLYTDHVSAETIDAVGRWIVDDGTNSIGALIIDSVDGASPSSLSDLYDKLVALIA